MCNYNVIDKKAKHITAKIQKISCGCNYYKIIRLNLNKTEPRSKRQYQGVLKKEKCLRITHKSGYGCVYAKYEL